MSDQEEKFLQNTHRCLEASTEQLPENVCRQLQIARLTALKSTSPRFYLDWRWLTGLTAGVAASAIWAILLMVNPVDQHNIPDQITLTVEEALALSDEVDLDEDVEFYQWLADEEEVPG